MKGEELLPPNILQQMVGRRGRIPSILLLPSPLYFQQKPADSESQRCCLQQDFIYFWAVSAVDRLLSPAGAAGRSGVLLLARRKNFHPSPHHHREFTHQQGNKQMAAVIVHDSLPSPVVRYHHHDPSRPPH